MRISAVIPSFESREALRLCLLSLAQQELDPQDSLEVVVVDDGSTDGTAAMVRDAGRRLDLDYFYLPRTARSGRSRARNQGIERARGDLIAMIDPDHVFARDFLAEHAGYHRGHPDLVVLGPRGQLRSMPQDVVALEGSFSFAQLPAVVARSDSRAAILNRTSQNFNNLQTGWHHTFTCNVSVRRDHVVAVGAFDEGFTGWGLEDSELGYRLRCRGLAFAYNPEAIAYTWSTARIDEGRYRQWRQNLEHFCRRHPALEVSLQYLLDDAFNPAVPDTDWLDASLRFEYAARAVAGRLPDAPYTLVEVFPGEVDKALLDLPALTEEGNVLVLDHADAPRLRRAVQCLDTRRELMYFGRLDERARARILASYQLRKRPESRRQADQAAVPLLST